MKPRPGQKKPMATITNPNAWDQSHGTYISGRSYIDGVDALAVRMERRWGCGRLRLLVDQPLREKFDRQRYKLSAAIHNGQLIDVQRESERMVLAWSALDKAATEAGAKHIAATIWETTLQDGAVVAIVQDAAEAHEVVAEGRQLVVYTLDEIGRMLSNYRGVLKIKQAYPGATVERVDKTIGDPLGTIRKATGFDDPIDDLFEPQSLK